VDVDALLRQLEADAEERVPPTGAESVRLARDLGPAAGDALAERARAGGWGALLALEALRAADPAAWTSLPPDEVARTYAEALATSRFFNAWGLPGYGLGDPARALLSLGPDAVAALAPLLDDLRPAPLEGSQDATTAAMYGNRVADYAWFLICTVRRGRDCEYPMDPAERDRLRAEVRTSLSPGGDPP
jgi:hypothetical protein